MSQTFIDFELILVNDGSTDYSEEIIKEFERQDKRVQVGMQKNMGVSSARNKGIDMARGKYLIFVDSDDTIQSNHLEEIDNKIDDTAFIITGYTYVDKRLKRSTIITYSEELIFDKDSAINAMLMYQGVQGYPFNKVFLTKLIQDNGLYFNTEISIAEDLLFSIEYCSLIKSAKYVPLATYNYFFRENSALNSRKNVGKFNNKNLSHLLALEKIENIISPHNYKGIELIQAAKTYSYALYFRLSSRTSDLTKQERNSLRKRALSKIKNYIFSDYSNIKTKLGVLLSLIAPSFAKKIS